MGHAQRLAASLSLGLIVIRPVNFTVERMSSIRRSQQYRGLRRLLACRDSGPLRSGATLKRARPATCFLLATTFVIPAQGITYGYAIVFCLVEGALTCSNSIAGEWSLESTEPRIRTRSLKNIPSTPIAWYPDKDECRRTLRLIPSKSRHVRSSLPRVTVA